MSENTHETKWTIHLSNASFESHNELHIMFRCLKDLYLVISTKTHENEWTIQVIKYIKRKYYILFLTCWMHLIIYSPFMLWCLINIVHFILVSNRIIPRLLFYNPFSILNWGKETLYNNFFLTNVTKITFINEAYVHM